MSGRVDVGVPTLHPSHRWGRRPIFERDAPGSNRFRVRKIPCCLNCLVDGYEDEPDAFEKCRRSDRPPTTQPRTPAGSTEEATS